MEAGRGAHRRHRDLPAVDHERLSLGFDAAGKRPVHAVVAEELRQHGGFGDVVDRDPFDVGATLVRSAERGPAGPAEAVDGNSNSHGIPHSLVFFERRSRGSPGHRRAPHRKHD
jgi:hypothetical protein